jgi:hypothetical protein
LSPLQHLPTEFMERALAAREDNDLLLAHAAAEAFDVLFLMITSQNSLLGLECPSWSKAVVAIDPLQRTVPDRAHSRRSHLRRTEFRNVD